MKTIYRFFIFLSLASFFVFNTTAYSLDEVWGGAFTVKATAGKSFGINLFEQTKSVGRYTLIVAPKWLRLTENGILFGSPQKADAGEEEVYFSVTDNGKENSFKILLTVLEAAPIATREYVLFPNEVFKVDLQEATGIKGRFEFSGAPKWLRTLESGIVVGMPEDADLGVTIFVVKVTGETSNDSFQVKLTVKKPEPHGPPQPPKNGNETVEVIPLSLSVGEGFSINVKDLFHWEGNYTVKTSDWLSFDASSLLLSGRPEKANIGLHEVLVSAEKGGTIQMGSFHIKVN